MASWLVHTSVDQAWLASLVCQEISLFSLVLSEEIELAWDSQQLHVALKVG